MPDDFPRIVTREQLRFDILYAVMKIPQGVLRGWATAKQLKSEVARNRIVDLVMDALDRYQVRSQEPIAPPYVPPKVDQS